MLKKSLYTEDGEYYTQEANKVCEDLSIIIYETFKKYSKQGFPIKQIEHLICSLVNIIANEQLVDLHLRHHFEKMKEKND